MKTVEVRILFFKFTYICVKADYYKILICCFVTVYWRALWPSWPIHVLPSCSMPNWKMFLDLSPWSFLPS